MVPIFGGHPVFYFHHSQTLQRRSTERQSFAASAELRHQIICFDEYSVRLRNKGRITADDKTLC